VRSVAVDKAPLAGLHVHLSCLLRVVVMLSHALWHRVDQRVLRIAGPTDDYIDTSIQLYHTRNISNPTPAYTHAHNASQTQALHHNPLLANLRPLRNRKHSAILLPTHPLTFPFVVQIKLLRLRNTFVPQYPHAKTPPRQPPRCRIRSRYVDLLARRCDPNARSR
jgi:hypothetical protein